MSNFIVIFACMAAGILCKRVHNFPSTTARSLNAFVIFLSLPSLVLTQMPKVFSTMNFRGLWWQPVSTAWIIFILSFIFFYFIGKKLGWSQAKIGALILTAGLGNTSFVGFPLLEALIGPEAIPVGILVDQPGSFLVLSTLGITVASVLSGSKINFWIMMKRVCTFPPFIALVISIFWALSSLAGFEMLAPSLSKVAATLVPLALFAVGFQLKFDPMILRKRALALSLGLSFKLILIPSLFFLIYKNLLHLHDLTAHVIVLESAMASMITSAVVASEFNLDTELANLMVGIGIPLSLLSVPAWNYFIKFYITSY